MKKIAYFDVLNGCAGDMIVGSLIDAGLDIKVLEEELKKLNLENFKLEVKKVKRKNNWGHIIEGTQFLVIPTGKWDDETPYFKIVKIIEESTFRINIKEKILKIFDILADSESKVHKIKKEKLHLHQVGQIDA
ncbi:MAG: DUF111 family protein, partial [bacterium]|nr:DUF111 family protein [bacterium]MDW8163362.1 pyridinium-3,5-bisthiocarboxylic acid mononucleotide nickel chelatase [Candidatus Omnitrophota bacterium]